ncbi:ABC-2 type transport system permease protein [Murinocardiopsis flavida]|uniref:ABC-2 type transport system permease protein n=1 Tax=Murinocardiopsis flavida TaxID=645275 RepID=A0A2P8DEK3_9ACTN|nr:ABC transporter permease subunit [Murinocardiopsis flavida]PSK95619.1 ABC-2 type transport system permease protein [Murinocardiopsis flavida]
MLLRSVFGKFLRDHRRAVLGWLIGISAVTVMYSSFFPTMKDAGGAYEEMMDSMPAGLTEAMGWSDFSSAEGYLGATVFGILGPVLMIIAAIMFGSRAIAGDEEEGGLELLLAHPVRRTSVLMQRFAAVALIMALLGLAMFAVLAALNTPLTLDLPAGRLFAACAMLTLIALSYGSAAFAAGAITGRRSYAVMAGAVLAVVGYLGNTFALQVAELEWLRFASAFYYAQDPEPLVNGFDAGFTAVLVAVPAVLLALGAGVFARRDVAV